jgi:hypothetical protein
MIISKKAFSFFLLIFTILFLGYFRDFVFVNINSLIQAKTYKQEFMMPFTLSFLNKFDYSTLIILKWLNTFLFCFLYFIITLISLQLSFAKSENENFTIITLTSYGAILLISALLILIGFIFSSTSEKMYEFARYLMGMAQSPIILMILIPAFKLLQTKKQE